MPGGSAFTDSASRQLEAVYRTPDVVAQRQATLRALALKDGDQVLDVGAGPGFLVTEMAEVVSPSGRVTGLDINEHMVQIARQRCAQGTSAAPAEIVQGDATALPFPDAAFDVAVSTQVYAYVEDIATALAELYRVLRPGGRAVILDTDWDSIVWHSSEPERMRRVLDAWNKRFADPHLPPTLAPRLRAAGFDLGSREVLVLFNPEYDPQTYSVTNAEIMADFVTDHGGMTWPEAAAWYSDLQQLGREGRYFFSLNRYLFTALKVVV
jgi:arsenite methyltransferase